MTMSRKKVFIITASACVAFVCTFLFGYFVRRPSVDVVRISTDSSSSSSEQFHRDIIAELKASEIEKNLRYFAGQPHAAARPRNNELGEEIHRRFQSYGFESKKESYNVLLTYPDVNNPNYAYILDNTGASQYRTRRIEKKLAPDEDPSTAVQPFSAYSPAGTTQGDLVYVNYGRKQDFEKVEKVYNISCKGKIVIARYGKVYRGAKLKYGQAYGAAAVLVYNDPADYAPTAPKDVFPQGWWLSSDGVQRGSFHGGDGDPLTPFYPSTDDAFRIDAESKEAMMPRIPCHPISADDAYELLKYMDGPIADQSWTGNLNLTYKIGPGFSSPREKWKIKVDVHNQRKQMKITNIIGILRGSREPDRYVLVGNHRDAWVNGAADPSSGTASMMEVARAIGLKAKEGWRPLRSIVFCSWDGEEHGLIGSVEWTEQHGKVLTDRAVAYINLDTVVFGNYSLRGASSPLFYDTLYKAAGETEDPFEAGKTALDKFLSTYPSKTRPGKPDIRRLGAGSDYFAFYHRLGIPSLDLSFGMKQINSKYNTSFYPVYHTMHDTFTWMTKFVDPTFRCHLTIARVALSALLRISDSDIIPWNVKDYTKEIELGLNQLKNVISKANVSFNANIDYLSKAAKKFSIVADKFHNSLKTEKLSNLLRLRMINDRLTQLEKGFILQGGLPGRKDYSHMIFSPASFTKYGPSPFPTVVDSVSKSESDFGKQLSMLASTIEAVAETLTDGL